MTTARRHDDQTSGLDHRDRPGGDHSGGDRHEEGTGLLAIYLNDHRAGASAGRATAERCRAANLDNELGRYLGDMLDELDLDASLLDDVRHRVGARPSTVKRAVAEVTAQLGGLKFNGRLTGYSPSSRVLELEGLQMGVHAKRAMWHALASLQSQRVELAGFDFDTPQRRATGQLEALDRFHAEAIVAAFG